jgi:hypothetical protein
MTWCDAAEATPSSIRKIVRDRPRGIAVEDAQSIGAMRALSCRLGSRVGRSTGTNLVACAELIEDMAAKGERGSIVTILCDGGERATGAPTKTTLGYRHETSTGERTKPWSTPQFLDDEK